MYAPPMAATGHYRAQSVETAGPAQLVLMLYDGTLAALTRARQADSPEVANRELQRAQDIVTELQVTLDHERGGDIAASMSALYTFCIDRLIEANIRKDFDQLDAVADVIGGLRESWEQACVGVAVAS